MLSYREIDTDFCVIGGGMAGISAAITAARLGLNTVIVQERPVFGGNASGEVRMWICGADGYTYKEAGIVEELTLENYFYNPTKNYNLWNALLYGKVKEEKRITPLLNCTVYDAETSDGKIKSVTAYQMTTQTKIKISAKYFADCSGDSITAPLCGAEFMRGREGKKEYGEPMRSHDLPDGKTMGNSVLIQARKTDKKVPFRAPEWAEKVPVEKLKSKGLNLKSSYENFWYIELGGNDDVIANAETLNERLIALCLGVWNTVKNSGEFDADFYELEFLGFLPAKRESRRLKGDYVLTANDILSGGDFYDAVAYGGWPLDDHNPDGFDGKESNYVTPVPKPYGIPYRCLYSANVDNLFFAGRNVSMTHMAMSSARVMGTCSCIGQAVGAAAHIANKYGLSPRGVLNRIEEVRQILSVLDCYIPNYSRKTGKIGKEAELTVNGKRADVLRNGKDRNFGGEDNSVKVGNGGVIRYKLDGEKRIEFIKIVFDSDIRRDTFDMDACEKTHGMRCNILDTSPLMHMPKTLVKSYRISVKLGGKEVFAVEEKENKKRNVIIPVGKTTDEVSLTVNEGYGEGESGIFTFELF